MFIFSEAITSGMSKKIKEMFKNNLVKVCLVKLKPFPYNTTCKHSDFFTDIYFQCLLPPMKSNYEMQYALCKACSRDHVENCTNYHTISYEDIY